MNTDYNITVSPLDWYCLQIGLDEELCDLLHGVIGAGNSVPDCPGRLKDLMIIAALHWVIKS